MVLYLFIRVFEIIYEKNCKTRKLFKSLVVYVKKIVPSKTYIANKVLKWLEMKQNVLTGIYIYI